MRATVNGSISLRRQPRARHPSRAVIGTRHGARVKPRRPVSLKGKGVGAVRGLGIGGNGGRWAGGAAEARYLLKGDVNRR